MKRPGSLRRSAILLLPFALAACADGVKTSVPASEVGVNDSVHLLSFRSAPGFGSFPVSPNLVFASRSTMSLDQAGNYSNVPISPSGSTSTDRYTLARTGAFDIYQQGGSRDPSIVFRGGFDYAAPGGTTPSTTVFFTDRVSSSTSSSIGLYYGTHVLTAEPTIDGDWFVMSLHAILAPNTASAIADNVGRAMHGSVTIGPAPTGDITGSGTQSAAGNTAPPQASVLFGPSSITYAPPIAPDTAHGRFAGTLDYAGDPRSFQAVAGPGVILGLDDIKTDASTGLIVFVQKFATGATPPAPAVPASVAGTYQFGGHTLFIVPTNMGSDTFIGTLTLTASTSVQGSGTFQLDGESHTGASFRYSGSYSLTTANSVAGAYDGGIRLNVSNPTTETWFAAVSRDYQTLVMVDDWPETRTNNIRELQLGIGVRQKSTTAMR